MRGLDSTVGIVALAAVALAVVALLLCLWMASRLRRLRADQTLVLGAEERDIVAHSRDLTRSVEALTNDLTAGSAEISARLDAAEERLEGSISHTAVLRYDALNEPSGRQSSSIALLDDRGDGVVISSILQREQARVYAKAVVAGRSSLDLSPEEERAISAAAHGADPASGGGGKG